MQSILTSSCGNGRRATKCGTEGNVEGAQRRRYRSIQFVKAALGLGGTFRTAELSSVV